MRFRLALVLAVLASAGGSGAPSLASDSPAPRAAVVAYSAPLPPPLDVLRPFAPPATRYGPGHLGVDLRAAAGAAVRSAADGVVTFAGQVAERGLVVIAHADGVRTEYEPLHPLVARGDRVRRGQVVGTIGGRHRGCPVCCLHWGARRGETYVDPMSLLRRLGPVVLLPWPRAG